MATLLDEINAVLKSFETTIANASAPPMSSMPNPFPNGFRPAENDPLPLSPAPQIPFVDVQNPDEIGKASETQTQEKDMHPLRISLTVDNLIQGILLSEILGKPVSMRRGHSQR
jgi:hypothetical protein